MSHSQVSDEQLILCYRQNSKEAYDILLKRKHHDVLPLLKKYANQCKPFGVEMNDLYAVYLESFHKAILRFVFEKITSKTYHEMQKKHPMMSKINKDTTVIYTT